MSESIVTVCLPNLNSRPFLDERVQSILNQSLASWELVVSDNFSDDGAWEYFEELARLDRRVSIAQAPRNGMYANWNNCLERARGEFVYFATSDDTMAEDCLEKLVSALRAREECDIAHCPLRIIDKWGGALDEPKWLDCVAFSWGAPGIEEVRHVRRGPYDALLQLTGHHVVLSMTQLLIRRSLFDRTGPFASQWGSVGDFNWQLKAHLVSNMVHVPDTWASWRIHSDQATAAVDVYSPERDEKFEQMVADAVSHCGPHLDRRTVDVLMSLSLSDSADLRRYYAALRRCRDPWRRRLYQVRRLVQGSAVVRGEILGRMVGRERWTDRIPKVARALVEAHGLGPAIQRS